MITTNKTLYLCKDESYKEDIKEGIKNIKVILLKEDIFIKVIKLNKKDNIDDVLKGNISSTFSDYDKLIHYEVLKIFKEKFLIIYFINYYNKLRNIVSKCRTMEISPYQLKNKKGKFFKGISLIVTNFKDNLYLIIKINGVVVHTKNIVETEIEEAMILSMETLKKEFHISDLKTRFYFDKDIDYKKIGYKKITV